MIRPIASDKNNETTIEEKLKSLVLSEDFLYETGVVFEYYMRVFGWPDFVVSLYGANENLLKQAILCLREKCGALITSSIIGVCPEDPYLRIAEYSSNDGRAMINKLCENGNNEQASTILAENMRLETAKEYVVFHKAMIDSFSRMVDRKNQNKGYQCEIEKNEKIFKVMLERLFFANKEIPNEEKEKIINQLFKK
jgi:hypothetical protein